MIKKNDDGLWSYSFSSDRKHLLDLSLLGFKNKSGQTLPKKNCVINSAIRKSYSGVWHPVWGKRKNVKDQYNELALQFNKSIKIIFRAYNDGIAYRYVLPDNSNLNCDLKEECSQFNFSGDFSAWYYNFEYHNLGPEKLSETDTIRHPVMTIKADDSHYMAVHEADLEEGEPLILSSKKGKTLFNVVSSPAALKKGSKSAWRVILYGKTPGTLVDSHLIELLNPDPLPGYNFSWVKPSVAVWDWRINGAKWNDFTYTMSYPSWVKMIDFASEQGFKYLVLDANWYGPEFKQSSDPTTGDKAESVKQIIKYGKEKGVGVWLYLNDVGGRKYPIEKTLEQYKDWGAAGVKYGFMRGSQTEKNAWTRKITTLCAKNKLLVDFHDGPVHPYGQMRTWPNAVTREYCEAQLDAHRVFQPKTFVTTVFVNMLAGPIDMDNGMFDLRQGKTTRVDESQPVPSTLVSEAARTLIVFSGVTILPDIPEYYRKYPDLLQFISAQKMPWVESKTLAGEIGEYIVMMRQTDKAYLIGAATNESKRDLEIPMSFLGKGTYKAKVIEDGADADYLTNRESIKVTEKHLTNKDMVKVSLAAGGGACLIIEKE